VALALMVAWPVTARSETIREESQRSVEIPGISRILAQNSRGRIGVKVSPDRSLHISALKIVRATNEDAARRLADDTIVELNRAGSQYEIQVHYPHSSSHINLWENMGELTIPRIEVRLALEVPSGVAVELDGASADLDGEGLKAPLTLHSASGDADLHDCVGDIQISTASGDVTIEGSRMANVTTVSGDVHVSATRGPLRIRTSSGDVAIGDMGDSLAVETTSGDVTVAHAPSGATIATSSGGISLRHAAGRVRAHAVSGDVKAVLEPPLRGAEIVTSSGGIGVGLEDAVGCALELRTSSGSLDIGVPCRTQTLTRQLVSAVVRQGTTPVVLRSVSGDITVTRGEP
jgi:DUF4097 and DUF4098 domain-containing protein YvlB